LTTAVEKPKTSVGGEKALCCGADVIIYIGAEAHKVVELRVK